jgi:hydrogenase maturation protein HypF
MKKTYSILISGIVQGVGFRPFIYNVAQQLHITGWVKNTPLGIKLNITCSKSILDDFIVQIKTNAPPLSHILTINYREITSKNFTDFQIKTSVPGRGVTLISPDIAICDDCVKELFNINDKRYLFPFINCTNCGPRYSIIRNLPYDRAKTTMDEFELCDDCLKEYIDPLNRRFHAQPVCCHKCGPHIYMGDLQDIEAIKYAAVLIDNGEIIAVKGLGGYHIICDAGNDKVVETLRKFKKRNYKPLAVMCKDIVTLKKYIKLDESYYNLLTSAQAPIVILNQRIKALSKLINTIDNTTGIMLAYTPLHKILMEFTKTDFIVATSGNIKDEPISIENEDAEKKLSIYTKQILHHNREIFIRVDDSVATLVNKKLYILRRARGFAPYPVLLPKKSARPIMGLGAHLKNTICLGLANYAFVSQYIGDLDNVETIDFFKEVLKYFTNTFNVVPEVYITDLHPDYFTSRWADKTEGKIEKIQHHLSHMSACMAENNLKDNVIGVIFDGVGLGMDSKIWGGEFFVKKNKFKRIYHLEYYKQPGGDSASINPYIMLVGYLYKNKLLQMAIPIIEKSLKVTAKEIDLIVSIIESNINSPETSSMGRLFEAVGSLLSGIKQNEFEAHTAIALEGYCDATIDEYYPYSIENNIIIIADLLFSIIEDLIKNIDKSVIATKFHNTIACMILEICTILRQSYMIKDVVLSGGVFQNKYLLEKTIKLLQDNFFCVFCHSRIPANDGCISLGQVYYNIMNFSFDIETL